MATTIIALVWLEAIISGTPQLLVHRLPHDELRGPNPMSGLFSPPFGFIKEGESSEECMVRTLKDVGIVAEKWEKDTIYATSDKSIIDVFSILEASGSLQNPTREWEWLNEWALSNSETIKPCESLQILLKRWEGIGDKHVMTKHIVSKL